MNETEKQTKTEKKQKWIKRSIYIISGIILCIAILYSYARYVGTKGLHVNEYKITNTKITNNFHGFKIVHISDIHYGRTIQKNELEQMVNKINELKPDIVVLTGDLIDKDTKLTETDQTAIIETLKKIKVTINKYAIMGNHDHNFAEWNSIITESHFTNINDAYELIYNKGNEPILIAGISTNLKGSLNIQDKIKPINEYINNTENSINQAYKILLIHEPDYIEQIDYKQFDLILAGHTHGGQVRIPPFGSIILPPGGKKYKNKYYKLNNTELYISYGIGTSTVNLRLFNKPSINFYRLTNKP